MLAQVMTVFCSQKTSPSKFPFDVTFIFEVLVRLTCIGGETWWGMSNERECISV